MPSFKPVTFDEVLAKECHIFVSALFKRELIEQVGCFDESLRAAEDFDLWLRMLRHGCRFSFTTEPLVKYRWRSNSLSNNGVKMMQNLIALYERLRQDAEMTPSQRAIIERKLKDFHALLNWWRYREMLEAGRFDEAAQYLALANEHYRKLKYTLVKLGLHVAPSLVARLASK
jgi:GT2 family glycosyltransferase